MKSNHYKEKGLDNMKVLLLEDVYKLGRAGDVKKVAPGYARNYLMPQGLAVLATPGAMKQAGRIKKQGEVKRAKVNQELGGVSEQLEGKRFTFAAKASETRRLYGSINTQMIAEAVSEEIGVEVTARQVESQPLRMLGRHSVAVRLTVDLIPEIEIIVHREGETPESALEEEEKEALKAEEALAEILEEEQAEMESDVVDAESDQTVETELPEESEEETEETEEA
jgi:large subunit ribosomal protein L9